MSEQQWIDWHPKVGDLKPARYQIKLKDYPDTWDEGLEPGLRVTKIDSEGLRYRIPAPSEDRPPWIDPQCKFRWGDRVKDKEGNVWFVNNPWDLPKGTSIYPVTCTKSLWDAPPYSCYQNLTCDYDIFNEDDLTLFPEDLPQHFDDRIIDADQPQEQPKPVRVPREIWVNVYHESQWWRGCLHETQDWAEQLANKGRIECIHFREVL